MTERAYKINGIALPTPDNKVKITEEDMHGKSWRDGAGILHLVVIRRGVLKTPLQWSYMSQKDFDILRNACRRDANGTYTFEDLFGNQYTIYTGADLTYTLSYVDDNGEGHYEDVKLSFIQV